MRTNYKKAYERSIDIIDQKIEEIRKRKMGIFRKLCYKLPEDDRINMSIGTRILELKKIAFRDNDSEMKLDLLDIDELDAMLAVLKDVKTEMESLV